MLVKLKDRNFWLIFCCYLFPLLLVVLFFYAPLVQIIQVGIAWTSKSTLDLWNPIWHTLVWGLLGTALSLLIGLPLAFCLYRHTFFGSKLIRSILNVSFFLPTVVVGLMFHDFQGSLIGIIIAFGYYNFTIIARNVGQVWQTINPKFDEMSASFGFNKLQTIFKVTLPLLRSTIIKSSILVFLFCATSFGVLMMLGDRSLATLGTTVYYYANTLLDLHNASIIAFAQIIFAVFILVMSMLIKEKTNISNGTWELPTKSPIIILFSYLGLFLILFPIFSIFQFDDIDLGLIFESNKYLGGSLASSILWTVESALIASALAILVILLLIQIPHQKTVYFIWTFPLGVSAVLVGFGLLVLHGSNPALIPISQSLIAIPIIYPMIINIKNNINPKLFEVADTLGVPKAIQFFKITLPILSSSLLVSFGYAFFIAVGEFGATTFLVRSSKLTLPNAIYRLLNVPGEDNMKLATYGVVILIIITAIFIPFIEYFQKKDKLRY